MPRQVPLKHLRVSPQYAIYQLKKERLVVLYSTTGSLLISGIDEYAVFALLNRPTAPWISEDELFNLPKEQQLIVADLLGKEILCYFNLSEMYSNGTLHTSV